MAGVQKVGGGVGRRVMQSSAGDDTLDGGLATLEQQVQSAVQNLNTSVPPPEPPPPTLEEIGKARGYEHLSAFERIALDSQAARLGMTGPEFYAQEYQIDPNVDLDIARGIVSGVVAAGEGFVNTIGSLMPYGAGAPGGVSPEGAKAITGASDLVDSQVPVEGTFSRLQKTIEPRTAGGKFVKGATQFTAGFVPVSRVLRSVGLASEWVNAFVAGLVSEQIVFDPQDPNFVNGLQEWFPSIKGPISEALATDPNDPEWENRLRNAAVGAGLGLATEGVVRLVKMAKRGASKTLANVKTSRALKTSIEADEAIAASTRKVIPLKDLYSGKALADASLARDADKLLNMLTADRSNEAYLIKAYRVAIEKMDPDGRYFPGVDPSISTIKQIEAARASGALDEEHYLRTYESLGLTPPTMEERAALAKPTVREKMIADFAERVKGHQPGEFIRTTGDIGVVAEARQEHQFLLEKARKLTVKKILNSLQTAMFDRVGPMKTALLKEFGDEGHTAVREFEVMAGAPATAKLHFDTARQEIYGTSHLGYGGIEEWERQALDAYIASHRMQEILKYRPDFEAGTVKDAITGLPRKATREDFVADHFRLKERVGTAKYQEIQQRSDAYFDAMRRQVPTRLYEEGLISEDEFGKLVRFDYTPVEYVDLLDPRIQLQLPGKKAITVTSSGIPPLGKGADLPKNIDSMSLLQQSIGRVEARVAKNRANQSLANLATDVPANSLVRLHKPTEGEWVGTSYMDDGKLKKMWLAPEIAEQWTLGSSDYNHVMAQLLGTVSGAPIVRALATGINPEFIPRAVLRDIQGMVLLTDEYSPFLPLAYVQVGRDLGKVFMDALHRGPKTRAYIEEGGGMSFMAHGATSENIGKAIGRRTLLGRAFGETGDVISENWDRAINTASYLNETAEIAVRLAIRDRAMLNGSPSREATWVARNYMDFSQGGRLTKFIDVVAPYTNVGMLGLRKFGEAIRQRPVKTALYMTQFATGAALLWAFNNRFFKDVIDQVPDENKARAMHFPLGMSYQDEVGETRHIGLALPILEPIQPMKAAMDFFLDKLVFDKEPVKEIINSLKAPFGVAGDPFSMIAPIPKAAIEYVTNHSLFTGQPIYKGSFDIHDPASEYNIWPDTPTSRLARDVGTLLDLSPQRLESSFQTVFPQNPISTAVAQAYGLVAPEDTARREGNPFAAILKRFPMLRGMLFETHPLANLMEDTQQAVQPGFTERLERTKRLDYELYKMTPDILQIRGDKDLEAFVKARVQPYVAGMPKEEQESAVDRAKRYIKVELAYKDRPSEYRLPPKSWWNIVTGYPPKQRAGAFYNRWSQASPQEQAWLMKMAKAMPSFWTAATADLFEQERKAKGE